MDAASGGGSKLVNNNMLIHIFGPHTTSFMLVHGGADPNFLI